MYLSSLLQSKRNSSLDESSSLSDASLPQTAMNGNLSGSLGKMMASSQANSENNMRKKRMDGEPTCSTPNATQQSAQFSSLDEDDSSKENRTDSGTEGATATSMSVPGNDTSGNNTSSNSLTPKSNKKKGR